METKTHEGMLCRACVGRGVGYTVIEHMNTCSYIETERDMTEHRHTKLAREDLVDLLGDDEVVYGATQIFDALSDFTRFQILSALSQGERSVSELVEIASVSQSAISHQMRMLRDRGLVSAHREGQRMIYALADEHVSTLISVGLQHASEAVKGGRS